MKTVIWPRRNNYILRAQYYSKCEGWVLSFKYLSADYVDLVVILFFFFTLGGGRVLFTVILRKSPKSRSYRVHGFCRKAGGDSGTAVKKP